MAASASDGSGNEALSPPPSRLVRIVVANLHPFRPMVSPHPVRLREIQNERSINQLIAIVTGSIKLHTPTGAGAGLVIRSGQLCANDHLSPPPAWCLQLARGEAK